MRRKLKIAGFCVLVLLLLAVAAVTALVGIRPIIGPRARPLTERRFDPTSQRVERGQYLATSVSGCVLCHSELDWQSPGFPAKAGTEGGGRSWAEEGLPWITAPNITPDLDTGVGRWSDDTLARAIREGIGLDGRAHVSADAVSPVQVHVRRGSGVRHRLSPNVEAIAPDAPSV